jgi:transglutaminase-like putative cysteine protease
MEQPERDSVVQPGPEHLAPTRFIDADHPLVRELAERAVDGERDGQVRIRRLCGGARRDPLRPLQRLERSGDYVASNVISRGAAYCVPKAVVLTAAARALGIPARLGFSDVRNHLQSERL